MPILELPPNPARLRDDKREPAAGEASGEGVGAAPPAVKLRSSRFGELEEHEIIHLLDSIDDERARASFRESVYISIIICIAIAWFLLYGPRVLFHQPEFQDPIALLKQHDKELTYITPRTSPAPRPPARTMPDRKTLQQLQQQPRTTPQPPAPQQNQQLPSAPQPQEQAHVNSPQVNQPALPLPSAPSHAAQQALPDAPRPTIAQNNTQSARDLVQQAIQGARAGRSGAEYGSAPGEAAGPLQAGATILSDTMGVDFSAYMRRLHHDIQQNWDPLIPQEVQPPLYKKGIVGIRFIILPDGSISGPNHGQPVLETPSGDVALDKAAWYAITSEGKFPPLPKEFHGPQLELRVGFFYNTPIQ
jgi:hypothetical protein